MFNFPFFNYQYNYPYYRNYNRYYHNYTQNPNYYINQNKPTANNATNNTCNQPNPKVQAQKTEQQNSITNSKEISNTINHKTSSTRSEQAIFEIMGIKLFLDDLVILGVLFFLYQEEVKDEMLYIILFLLLFS